jgi:hypothetical protein
MTTLGNSPPGIQASASHCAVRGRLLAVAERCWAARVRSAAAHPEAPLPPARRSASGSFATDGSAGNQMLSNFFVLRKTTTKSQLTKHHRRSPT